MSRNKIHITRYLSVFILLFLFSCDKDSDYHYPSVKLEFVTIESGDDGTLQSLLPDKGDRLTITNDYTNSSITPNSSKRVLSNYEIIEGTSNANIYSLQAVIVLEPQQKSEDNETEETLAKDPVRVTSIWMGRDYLNMILNVKIKGGKPHSFEVYAEEESTNEKGEKTVVLSLYHNANGDEEYYNRNAYISIPLISLAEENDQNIRIKFKYYTTGKDGQVVESDKYCNKDFEGFEYIPSYSY